jgi:hypothetical protein
MARTPSHLKRRIGPFPFWINSSTTSREVELQTRGRNGKLPLLFVSETRERDHFASEAYVAAHVLKSDMQTKPQRRDGRRENHKLKWEKVSGLILCLVLLKIGSQLAGAAEAQPLKQHSAFYTPAHLAQIRANVREQAWAGALRDQVVAACQPWMELTDQQIWELMFAHTISRSWMVWSDGYCPACKKSVEMYLWKMEAWKAPWKVRCPNCQELFPKNDLLCLLQIGPG